MEENRKIIYFVLAAVFSSLLTSCVPMKSSLKWGLLQYYESVTLLRLPPPKSVDGKTDLTVCADNELIRGYVEKSVLAWAKVIGRNSYINITQNGCPSYSSSSQNQYDSSSDMYNSQAMLQHANGTTMSVDIRLNAQAETQKAGIAAYTEPHSGEIKYGPDTTTYGTILHEVGHNWGLCDQYIAIGEDGKDTAANCNDNLAGHGNSNKVTSAVMGAGHRSDLTDDDIEGIKYIVNQPGVAQNDQWKAFLEKTLSSNNDSNSNNSESSGSEPAKTAPDNRNPLEIKFENIYSDMYKNKKN